MAEWNAAHYHQVSDPQTAWGLKVLDRLSPVSGERILDIGCGTGRLTAALKARVPSARAFGMDASPTMVAEAQKTLGPSVPVLRADGVHLPFVQAFDAVFSTATFHWIPDHERLFSEIYRVLNSGGRLVAQAGGGPNLARLYTRAAALGEDPRFADRFAGWRDPWFFAGVDDTRARLNAAGFTDIKVWLESTPTPFADAVAFRAFIATVCLRHQLHRLDDRGRSDYLDQLVQAAASDDPPLTLDYWRLNIDARRR